MSISRALSLTLLLILSTSVFAQSEYVWVRIVGNFITVETSSPAATCRGTEPEAEADVLFLEQSTGRAHSLGGLSIIPNSPTNPVNNYTCLWSGTRELPDGSSETIPNMAAKNIELRGAGCSGEFTDGVCRDKDGGRPPCCDSSGNPINKLTGHKYQNEKFFSIGGTFPLVVEAHYNSRRFTAGFNVLSAEWTWNFSSNLNVIQAASRTGVVLTRADGKQISFEKNSGETEFVADANEVFEVDEITQTIEGEVQVVGYLVTTDDDKVEEYDEAGRLIKVTTREGLSHHYSYDASNIQIVDDFGNAIDITLNSDGNPISILDPDGNEYRFAYNSRRLLQYASYPDETPGVSGANPFGEDNPFREYHYEESFFIEGLTGITDENGDRFATWDYDNNGYAQLSEHAGGVNRFTLNFNQVSVGNFEVTETTPLGKQIVTTFTEILDRRYITSEVRQAATLSPAATRTTTYDPNGFVSSRIDWNGNETRYVHNSRGLEESRTEAFGTPQQRTITTTWHPVFRKPTQIVEEGRTTTLSYNAEGKLLSRTELDTTTQSVPYSTAGRSRTTTFTYVPIGTDGANQIATIDGPRTDVSDVTTFTYTPEGFVKTVTNPLGHTTEILSYNSKGQPLSVRDANNVVTNNTYHPRGWLLTSTVVDPGGGGDATTTNEYDDVGQLTKVTLPNGAFLNYEYDAAHRLTAISNNLGERQEFTLDDAGNITAENTKDSGGSILRTQSRVYDELSRIYQVTGGANQLSQMAYDNNGNETNVSLDPSGINQSTLQAFDALNRLSQVTDALTNNSSFSYDARDNLTSVTDQRGLTTTFTYDGLNNLIQQDSPDTGVTVFTYDDAGNQISKTDARGVVTNNSYDALNRLTAVSYPASPAENIEYAYDQPAGGFGVGRLTQITDQTGSTNFVYDHRGNQVTSTITIQANTYSTQYVYDLADNLVQTTYPSGRTIDHQLDVLGRTQGITTLASTGGSAQNLASNIAYLPFGPMNALEYGNNLDLVISNDLDYRVTGISVQDGAGQNADVLGLTYTQNAVDNITAIADSVDTSESQTFIYDLLNRLEDATGDYGNQSYTYDGVGNRLSLTRVVGAESSTEIYSYDSSSNRLLSVDKDGVVRTLQYDAAGNIVSDDRGADQGIILEYNDQNRLLNTTPAGGQ